ncbi:hypothetical protein JXX18_00005, partial [Ruthenibacterium lactatiformans]|uniref:hypothetical protein n=1 Tax=Ruthenibacterium lactatiformans TaxID=1550024 RepID=UPI001966EFA7
HCHLPALTSHHAASLLWLFYHRIGRFATLSTGPGYYANTAGKNAIKIVERVEHQMKKGRAGEPPTMLK